MEVLGLKKFKQNIDGQMKMGNQYLKSKSIPYLRRSVKERDLGCKTPLRLSRELKKEVTLGSLRIRRMRKEKEWQKCYIKGNMGSWIVLN